MTADLSAMIGADDPRIELQQESDDYHGEYHSYREQLTLTRQDPTRVWYAAAYTEPARRFAGRAWSFLDGDLAGIFDMEVWEPFRRRGLGSALLNTVCAVAREAGAVHAVLNATPDGKQLYDARGFTQIGEGITWWHHMDAN
jgi:GNAT superfamily N-acetyltransferase